MQEAVTRFVNTCLANAKQNSDDDKQKPHGLFLIDMPTGSGKTYTVLDMIARYLNGEILQDVPRIIYLTPLNKNVKDAYNDLLKNIMEPKGAKDLFESNCLWVKANSQAVLDSFKEVEQSIPKEIKKKDSYHKLKGFVEGYEEACHGVKEGIASTKMTIETDIREKFEPAFRQDLKLELNKICHNKASKMRKIREDWKFILTLYPSVLIEKRKVLFMNVDKFYMPIDPIISKPFNFSNSPLLKGALVFIDEFDASKEFILRSQISQSTQRKLDLIKYMSTLSSTFASGKKFPKELFPAPKDGDEKKSSQYAFGELKRVIEGCRKNASLDYHFKLDSGEKEKRCLIFQDSELHTVCNLNTTPSIDLYTDEKRGLNVIKLDKEGKGSKKFFNLIYSMTGALNFSIRTFSMMSRNYLNYYNYEKRKENGDMMAPEEAISTIINPFELDQGIQSVISNIVTGRFNGGTRKKANKIVGESFYVNGFRYFDFVDDLSHDTTTSINMCFLNDTPEQFMVSIASSAMVVGISATATIDTVTGNYNLDYLKNQLGGSFVFPSKEDSERISTKFLATYKEGRDYKVNITKLDSDHEDNESLAKDIFKNQDNIETLSTQLRYFDSDNKLKYEKRRFMRVLLAVKSFLENPRSKALLVLTNQNMKTSGVSPFNKETMESIVAQIQKENELKNNAVIHLLHGNNYDQEKRQYQTDIRSGKRVILFTSYPASGTGQNLQYSIMEGADEGATLQKDIDSIYLEKPTNVLVNINLNRNDSNSSLSEEDLIKYIYQVESLGFQGEISRKKTVSMVKIAFKRYIKGSYPSTWQDNPGSEYLTKSVNNHIVRTLEQAVGRICRTRDKNKSDVNIYLDKEIIEKVSFDPVKTRLMNKEFKAIVDASTKPWNQEDNQRTEFNNKAENRSMALSKRLDSLMERNKISWPQNDMEDWKEVREWLLKHPTLSKEELNGNPVFESLYLTLPKCAKPCSSIYFSGAGGDAAENAKKLCISLKQSSNAHKEISDNECNLVGLSRIPEVRDFFKDKGYALSFAKNEMILLPCTYINLYKGALGEAAGKAILESSGIRLKEITDPEKFEKFDFEVEGIEGVYIDFKLWSTDSEETGESSIKHIEEKLTRIGGKKAFIINIVAENDGYKIKNSDKVCRVPNIVRHVNRLLYIDREKTAALIKIINELR